MGDLSRNFSRSEIQCQCGCGKDDISPYLIERLQAVRNIYAKPMEITSGVRCKAHNEAVGGVKNSAHTLGLAVDIGCSSSKQRAQGHAMGKREQAGRSAYCSLYTSP